MPVTETTTEDGHPIDQVLRSAKHEEQAYNSCAGILHSCKAIPHGIVEEAARKCMLVSIHTLKES